MIVELIVDVVTLIWALAVLWWALKMRRYIADVNKHLKMNHPLN